MKRLHVHVAVRDLDESIRFYSTLFATEPAVRQPDYAKWMLEDPRVNFAISSRSKDVGLDHLGIQAETPGELAEIGTRLEQAGRPIRAERGVLLLRTVRQSLDLRSNRHRVGNIPYHRADHDLWRRHRPHRAGGKSFGVLRPSRSMTGKVHSVLFLCTGNSARSILGEALINHLGAGRFRGYSAGSFPKGEVNPFALALLRSLKFPVDGLRSKGWDEFATPDAPMMDFIFTVCDQAAGEVCPIWPGRPVTAHWGMPDPAAVEGSDDDKRRAFQRTLTELERRLRIFIQLPFESLDKLRLTQELRRIASSPANAAG
jgi:arsenate reductase